MQTGEFLSRPGVTPRQVVLSPAQRHLKRQMFDCFCTQKKVLQYFPIVRETFRTAPLYNFTLPPHDGKLYYELFDWGMTGPRWRKLVSEALQHLATSANPTDCVHSTSSPDALLFASAFRRD